MRLVPWLLAAIVAHLLASGAHAAGCDCAAIRLLPTDTPVCDAQGMSYANACLAECQGISAGPCMALRNSGAAPPLVHADMLDSEAPITLGDIDAFKAEGFRLAARVKMTTGTPYIPGLAPTQGGDAGAGAARRVVAASRITRDGLLYLMPLSSAMALRSSSPTQQSLPAFRGSLSSVPSEPATANRTGRPRSSRKLLQPTGADDRWEITSSNGAHTFPYTAVGMITGGCSGVLIGPSTVLTAGHCIYDTAARSFKSNIDFIPNRHDGGAHCTSSGCSTDKPVRAVWADTFFVNAGPPVKCTDGSLRCQTVQDYAYDIGIIRLEQPVGNTYGYLGVAQTCDRMAWPVTSAGYPGDRDRYLSRMFGTRGTLNAYSGCLPISDTAGVVSSNLDTAGGQSGSAIWDSNLYVRAVHVHGGASGPGHRTIVSGIVDWINKNRQ